MAKIGLTEGFTLIPEGTHVFKITEVNYKEDFGKMEVVMQTAKGQKHIERFSLLNKDGEPNQGGLNAFSYFAKTALDDFTVKLTSWQHLTLRNLIRSMWMNTWKFAISRPSRRKFMNGLCRR